MKNVNQTNPPLIAEWLLERFFPDEGNCTTAGDLAEVYSTIATEEGVYRAQVWYWGQVAKAIPAFFKNLTYGSMLMLKNYLKVAWRNVLKNKAFSFINIAGLAVGITAFLLIAQFAGFELSYDSFHEQGERIYRVTTDTYREGELLVRGAHTPNALGPALQADFPEVEDYASVYLLQDCRFLRPVDEAAVSSQPVKYREKRAVFATASFLKLFSFPMVLGNPQTALENPQSVVISESAARRYFPDPSAAAGYKNPIGKSLESCWFRDNGLTVSGVMKDVPFNSHLKFDFIIAEDFDKEYWPLSWKYKEFYTYILLAPDAEPQQLVAKLPAFSQKYLAADNPDQYIIQPLQDIHLYSEKSQEAEANGSAAIVYSLLTIAAIIILLAWVNYINLSTARSLERAKEVGMRKAMGSARSQLIKQFLFESYLINTLAMVAAGVLTWLLVPYFVQLTGKPLNIVAFVTSPYFSGFAGFILLGAFLSGVYPAFILSGFKPAAVLKGAFSHSASGLFLRKSLVVFQFAITVILVAATLAVYQQIRFMQARDLGIDIDQTLVIQAPDVDAADSLHTKLRNAFKAEALKLPAVQQVAVSTALPGSGSGDLFLRTNPVKRVGDDASEGYGFYMFGVDEDFVETFGLKILAGRDFRPGDRPWVDGVLINQEAARLLGFETPEVAIQQQIVWSAKRNLEIIGVINNYHHHSLKQAIDPLVLRITQPFYYRYFSLKIKTGQLEETIAGIRKSWQRVYPGSIFSFFFLDEQFNNQYQSDQVFAKVFGLFTIVSVVVACLGLFGLFSLTFRQRLKEIGVRKVLGASVSHIMVLLSKDFIRLMAIACVLALPAAYLAINHWLENYAYRIVPGWQLFVIPVFLIAILGLLTISYQMVSAARANPVDVLRSE